MGDTSPKGRIDTMTTTTDFAVADNRAAIRMGGLPTGRIAILTADRVEDVEFFFITARKPGDMPLELARFLERLDAEKARQARQAQHAQKTQKADENQNTEGASDE